MRRMLSIAFALLILAGCAAHPPPPPPPLRIAARGPRPCPGATWVEGHWRWEGKGAGHDWVPGHWRCP